MEYETAPSPSEHIVDSHSFQHGPTTTNAFGRSTPSPEALDAEIIRLIDLVSAQEPNFWSAGLAENNKSAHALFQYPAMMVPSVQRRLVQIIKTANSAVNSVYDPFVGAGTTLAAGLANNLNCYGTDINPLAVLLSRVRVTPVSGIENIIKNVIEAASEDTSETIEVEFNNLWKWFDFPLAVDLSRIRRAIVQQSDKSARRFLWISLAETIRLCSNDRTSTYKLHMRPEEEIEKRAPKAIEVFGSISSNNFRKLHDFHAECPYLQDYPVHTAMVQHGDSRKAGNLRGLAPFDLLVTSPPYGDNLTTVTYGQHSYLPLQWIDLDDIEQGISRDILRTTQQIDRDSVGGVPPQNYKEEIDRLSQISPSFFRTIRNLETEPADRQKKVTAFCSDLDAVMRESVSLLCDNAYLVITMGDRTVGKQKVPNSEILTELLNNAGVRKIHSIERGILNKRMAPRNSAAQTMATETITIYRKLPNG